MTIGPAPMIRMLSMSVRRGTLSAGPGLAAQRSFGRQLQLRLQAPQHEVVEALEQRPQVVRSGTGFRMSLEAERRAVLEGNPLERAVEQRAVCRLHRLRERALIDREAVILAGDVDAARLELLHRVVGAVVAELHLHGARAGGESEELVAEA